MYKYFATTGVENLIRNLSSNYWVQADGNDCSLLINYHSRTVAGDDSAGVDLDAKLYSGDITIYSKVDIQSTSASTGNILILDQKISAFKKSRIVVYVDEFGKPLRAEAQARKYFKSAKISCVFK